MNFLMTFRCFRQRILNKLKYLQNSTAVFDVNVTAGDCLGITEQLSRRLSIQQFHFARNRLAHQSSLHFLESKKKNTRGLNGKKNFIFQHESSHDCRPLSNIIKFAWIKKIYSIYMRIVRDLKRLARALRNYFTTVSSVANFTFGECRNAFFVLLPTKKRAGNCRIRGLTRTGFREIAVNDESLPRNYGHTDDCTKAIKPYTLLFPPVEPVPS